MGTKKKRPQARILTVVAFYLAGILLALLLGATHQIAGWVTQVTVALCLGRLVFLTGWGVAKTGRRWRV